MVSTRPLISKFSTPCTNPLVTVPSTLIAIGITGNFMFHSFFGSIARSCYLSLFSLSFVFTLSSIGSAKSTICQVPFFFFLTVTSSGCLTEMRWSICIPKSQIILCVSFSMIGSELCIYHFFAWSNLNFLHNSQGISFPTQSCLVLYTFCTYLLHSLIMWLIVSSLSSHNPHPLFLCVLSIFALT